MRVLIIPDIHGRKFWREAIKHIDEFDKIVFLGDYLDPYSYEYVDNPESMESDLTQMLLDIIQFKKDNLDKVVLLTGNHTDHYIWPKYVINSTRFDRTNCKKYNEIFQDNLDLFNLVYTCDRVIFSHAGVTDGWAQRVWEYLGFPENDYKFWDIVECLRDTPLSNFNNLYYDIISDVSRYRGGDMFYGSCEWADLREHISDYRPTNPGWTDYSPYFQVFGHTQVGLPIIQESLACLDCKRAFIIDTNTHKIEEYV